MCVWKKWGQKGQKKTKKETFRGERRTSEFSHEIQKMQEIQNEEQNETCFKYRRGWIHYLLSDSTYYSFLLPVGM